MALDSTRLRKAFKYPGDDSGIDMAAEDMDEEEQEKLLTQLRDSEASTNALYALVFTALPVVVTLPFLWYMVRARTASTALLCLLSVTSLLSSAYIMYFVPTGTPVGGGGDASSSSRRPSDIFATSAQRAGRGGSGGGGGVLQLPDLLTSDDESPINRFLPWLNVGICALLLVASWAYCSRTDVPEALWLFLLLPAVIFGMVIMARASIGEIQRGLNELQGMRYDYKGA